jgi:hypothetical protein
MMPLRSGDVPVEHVLDHTAGELVLAQEHLPGIFLFEEPRFFFAVGAHHCFDARVHRACDLDHPAHVQRIAGVDSGAAGAEMFGGLGDGVLFGHAVLYHMSDCFFAGFDTDEWRTRGVGLETVTIFFGPSDWR